MRLIVERNRWPLGCAMCFNICDESEKTTHTITSSAHVSRNETGLSTCSITSNSSIKDNIITLLFRQQGFGRCVQVREHRGQFWVGSHAILRNGNVRLPSPRRLRREFVHLNERVTVALLHVWDNWVIYPRQETSSATDIKYTEWIMCTGRIVPSSYAASSNF